MAKDCGDGMRWSPMYQRCIPKHGYASQRIDNIMEYEKGAENFKAAVLRKNKKKKKK